MLPMRSPSASRSSPIRRFSVITDDIPEIVTGGGGGVQFLAPTMPCGRHTSCPSPTKSPTDTLSGTDSVLRLGRRTTDTETGLSPTALADRRPSPYPLRTRSFCQQSDNRSGSTKRSKLNTFRNNRTLSDGNDP